MRIITWITLLFSMLSSQAQNLTDFKLVDKFKINGLSTKVYFKDPLKELIKTYPDFDNKDNKTKHELLSSYLHTNTLYIFQTSKKNEPLKSYKLIGNPRKIRTMYYFNLEISKADGSLDKTIDKTGIGGSFFEHMIFFQTPEGKKAIGKGVQIWGFFVMVEPYENLKNKVTALIIQDIENAISEDIIAKEEKDIEPLFEYQKCGLKSVKSREFTITIYQYDSLGKVKDKFPRVEKDTELYLSSISEDLIGVTSFPFFARTDKMEHEGNIIHLTSNIANIKHYLKDFKITMLPNSDQVEKIEGKLIIHCYTTEGHSTYDELYIAEFGKFGDCYLPKTVKFCPIDDIEYKRPRIITDIKYELK